MKSRITFLTIFINILVFAQTEKAIEIFAKIKNDSAIHVEVKNVTEDSLSVNTQDSKFFMIKEFKNKSGVWQPLEFWKYSTCGNSYFENLVIAPKEHTETEINYIKGKSPTEIRIKFLFKDEIYYSNSIKLKINSSKIYTKKDLKKDAIYNKVLNVSDKKLAERVVLLKPFATKEHVAKYNEWLKKITLKREKINDK
ncbi:hypothetical protein VUJ46_11760 [Chryseobacterium sp. MYb264]|uniref:hypothetical protein n=1 Tax=Chryseobacterium sp. MYb264 TaxID=2745153 RepID=UPI002E11403A|nr:hypothetical protein VUJ46_11760 [Chryseobacterium sp. MYb264]